MSNNLDLPQVTASTSDKDDFLNDIFALLDSSVTSAVAVDGSVNAAVAASAVQNYLKITATNVPKAGTTLTLPQIQRMFILKNDKASLGSVTFQLGTASITVPAGLSCIAHMDGTANGLEVVASPASSAAVALAALTDVDMTTAPTDGQALIYNAQEGKWKPGTVAASASSGSGSTTPSSPAIVSARFWRISGLKPNGGNYVGTGELQFFDVNGTKIASAAPFSNGADSDPIANVNDGDLTTFWTTRDTSGAGFVGLDLGTGATPYSLLISNRDGNDGCDITSFSIDHSDDKQTWTTIKANILPAAWGTTSNQTQTFKFQGS